MNTTLPSLACVFALGLGAQPATAAPQDAERATHTDTASTPQLSWSATEGGVTVRQYQLGCLSHLSYLVVADGEAAVIDPQRDIEVYLQDAEKLGATIRYVLLTHPHADFVAGHVELAHRAKAEARISERAKAQFAHHALKDGEETRLGSAALALWHTPGHTPDASTFLLRLPGAQQPSYAFTGDTLFVGSIGRPDLLDVPPAQLASQSFDSIERLKSLPDSVVVLPAHGAGSLCGAHLSPETTSTIGQEKATNPFLKIKSRASFVANVISHQPVAPQYFAMNVAMNRKGPPLVEKLQELPPAIAPERAAAMLAEGAYAVDLRDQTSYAKGHIPGSVNIALRGRLDTWMGIVVPVDAPLLLVGDEEELREGVFRLRRIGYDNVAGHVAGGIDGWRQGGKPLRSSRLLSPQDLFAMIEAGVEPIVIDVRSQEEYEDLRLGDVGNIPVTESARLLRTLDPAQPVIMACNSAYRSSMAVGLAERLGFADVGSLDGGLDAWVEAGLPVMGRLAHEVHGAAAHSAPAGEIRASGAAAIALPEPVDSALLARVLSSQPEAYAVWDLRSAAQFAEWSIPGSVHVPLSELRAKAAALSPGMRLVLVDRDGSTAFAAAGALLAHDPRNAVRALLGGVQAFYRDTQFGGAPQAAVAAPAPTSPTPAAAPAPAATPKAKKRSAGC